MQNSGVRIALAEFRVIPKDESQATIAKVKNIILTRILGFLQCVFFAMAHLG